MIKPVDETPRSLAKKREVFREQIRKDIQEALDKGISMFEFVGDYNFGYLYTYARDEADRIWRDMFQNITLPHHPEWKEKYKLKYIFLSYYDLRKYNPIKISSMKSNRVGERRVFCEILDMEKMKKECLARCEVILASQRAEAEKRRKLMMEADDETETIDFSEELP